DNIGLTQSFTIMAFVDNGTVSDADGEILVALNPSHRPTAAYVGRLRDELPRRFPGCTFFFEPADITSQILDFGLPAPIDVQVVGVNREANLAVAQKLRQEIAKVPGSADVHLNQMTDVPDLGRGTEPANVNHYNVQPTYDVYASVQGRDLGAVSADVQKIVDAARPGLPRGSSIVMRGQVESMNSSFFGLAAGLVFAVLL